MLHSSLGFKYLVDTGAAKRYYSSTSSSSKNNQSLIKPEMTDVEFKEWLRGFIDAEGCFAIKKTQHGYQFEFQIALHIDDLECLNFIQSRLNLGKIYLNATSAMFKVNRQAEV